MPETRFMPIYWLFLRSMSILYALFPSRANGQTCDLYLICDVISHSEVNKFNFASINYAGLSNVNFIQKFYQEVSDIREESPPPARREKDPRGCMVRLTAESKWVFSCWLQQRPSFTVLTNRLLMSFGLWFSQTDIWIAWADIRSLHCIVSPNINHPAFG